MITQNDNALIEHESESIQKPWVLLRELGYFEGFGHIPGRMMFNVVAGDYTRGSTVTIQSMLDLGLRVEVVR